MVIHNSHVHTGNRYHGLGCFIRYCNNQYSRGNHNLRDNRSQSNHRDNYRNCDGSCRPSITATNKQERHKRC